MSLWPARDMSLGRWLLVACFSSVKNHNVSGPHPFPSFTTCQKIPLPPLGRSYSDKKKHFAIGRNSERCSYHTDLSRFALPISDTSALNFSQFVGFQNSPNLSKIEKVAETCEFDGKEPLFVETTIAISIRVLGWGWREQLSDITHLWRIDWDDSVLIKLNQRKKYHYTMNRVKIFKGWPLQDAPLKLVQLWYKSFEKGTFCLSEIHPKNVCEICLNA